MVEKRLAFFSAIFVLPSYTKSIWFDKKEKTAPQLLKGATAFTLKATSWSVVS
jgi:hypothetical protein